MASRLLATSAPRAQVLPTLPLSSTNFTPVPSLPPLLPHPSSGPIAVPEGERLSDSCLHVFMSLRTRALSR